MVVQAAEVTGGIVERRVPWAARASRASRFGIRPRRRNGSSTVQVAPSSPRITRRSVGVGMVGALGCGSGDPGTVDRGRRSAGPGQARPLVDRQVGAVVGRDLVPLALRAVGAGQPAPELLAQG